MMTMITMITNNVDDPATIKDGQLHEMECCYSSMHLLL